MWNHRRSLRLSQACTVLAGAAVVAVLAAGPWLVRWVIRESAVVGAWAFGYFMATLYTGGAVALVLVGCLFWVLRNAARGQVFVPGNVRLLRWLSWCCFAGAAIAAVSGLYYLPWLVIGLAAAFVGLIVRVVKNILAEAIALKEENDLTV